MPGSDDEETQRPSSPLNRRDFLLTSGGVLGGGVVGGVSGVAFYRSYILGQDALPEVGQVAERLRNPPEADRPEYDLERPWIDGNTTIITEQTSTYQTIGLNSNADFNHPSEAISSEDISLRFAVVSDGHWGKDNPAEDHDRYPESDPAGLTFEETHAKAASVLNRIDEQREIDFIVLLGDNVHGNELLHDELIANFVGSLEFTGVNEGGDTFFGAFGNYDWSYADEWEADYGHPKNYSFTKGDYGFIIAGTGLPRDNHDGKKATADAEFIARELDRFENDVEGVLCFQHIPPSSHLPGGNDMPEVREQYARDIVGGVFVGHGHDRNDMFVTREGVPVFNCELIGNSHVRVPRGFRVVDIVN